MGSGRRVLVVVPNGDLRGSLVFALEAEGYEVTAKEQVPSLSWVTAQRFDCTVLDQKALLGEPYESIEEVWPDYPSGDDDFYFEEE